MDQLKSEIKNLRRRNASRHWYIPESSFFKVMTEDAIRRALIQSPPYQREEMMRKVFQQGRKIFGILVLLDNAALLSKFIEADQFEDAKLPFKEEILVHDTQLSKQEARDFNEKQWELTAPTFSRGTLNRSLGENTVLPFTGDVEIGQGSFGRVYEVTLDPDHQELGKVFPGKFARKEFKIDDYQKEDRSTLSHRKELQNLAVLNHLKHPNIVELVGSYTYDGRHNLLFRLADDGNLARLLSAERPTQFDSDETLVIALAALSSAVEHVHGFTDKKRIIDLELIGCHHDLRPRNVLVSGSDFILADFGLSTFKPLSQKSETPFKHVNDDYLAPECEDLGNKFEPGIVHRSSDIWSLGCIISEVATYMAFGHEGIKKFRQLREYKVQAFYLYLFHHGKHPSDSVEGWLSELESSSTRTCALLVRLVRRTLRVDQSERPKAKEVTWWLRLASLYEVAATVNNLFRQIRNGGDSLDIFLEDTRFDSWRYAIGILHLEDESNPQCDSCHGTTSQFDAILGCLFKLRKNLESRLSRGGDSQRLDLSRLLRLNDELHCFLSREQKQMSRQYFNITVMNGDDGLFERVENGDASVALEYDIRMRANIERINKLLEKGSDSKSCTMLVQPKNVELRERFGGDYHLGVLNDSQPPRPVWVEWRKYGHHSVDELEKLYGRAARIAELLSSEKPEAFRTLRCSHFFHDLTRQAFGLVFEIPRSTVLGDSVRPMDLHQLIEKTAKKYSSQPDLDDKFKLALSLATSLLELHSVGLLHKSLTTFNIVFFPDAGSTQDQFIREPFFVGFNHSRPDELLTFTSGLADSSSRDYQHPTYLREGYGYRREFDYYSLGIILLEIGFWQPFNEMTAKFVGLSYEGRRQKLLSDRVPLLRKHMGREYYEAVRCCIQGDFGGLESPPGGKELLLRFSERVVGRLHGCSV